ncbi:MAG: hypothetical protein M0R40_09815 [Firmicutes bacterium]|nr:hypothetical protein [Bacillota bacterium]
MAKTKKTQKVTDSFLGDIEEITNTPTPPAFNLEDVEESEVLESGAGWHDFEEQGTLIGLYQSPVIAEEDFGDQWEKGDTIGYLMLQANGRECICPANHQIAKHLDKAKKGDLFKIEFVEKSQTSTGKQFTKFRVVQMKFKSKS